VVMNEDVWQGLTDAQRAAITAAAVKAEIAVRDYMSAFETRTIEEAKANGMTVHQPTPEELARWKAASAPVIEKWLKDAGPLGRQVLDAANAL